MPAQSTVYFWPKAADSIPIDETLIVIAVSTLPTTLRSQARKLIRMAIIEVLAKKLACQCAEIKLVSQSGQPLKVLQPKQNIGLSISHESGLSVAAINMNGRVGIDLIDIKTIPNNNEMYNLASEYLGLQVAKHIALLPIEQQRQAFAKAWTEFEACLKYQEKKITEWTTFSTLQPSTFASQPLKMPSDHIGTVVFSGSFKD